MGHQQCAAQPHMLRASGEEGRSKHTDAVQKQQRHVRVTAMYAPASGTAQKGRNEKERALVHSTGGESRQPIKCNSSQRRI